MDNLNPDWIMAIIALVAIISPSITAWITNYYQLKLKKIELFERKKYESIEIFTNSVDKYYLYRTNGNAQINFEASISNLFIYFSIPNYSLFDKLKECIKSNDYSKTQFAVSEIVRFLSSQINK